MIAANPKGIKDCSSGQCLEPDQSVNSEAVSSLPAPSAKSGKYDDRCGCAYGDRDESIHDIIA
jgi:hypothetical protein